MMKKTTLFSLLVPAALLVGCHERSAVNGLTVEMLDCPLGVAAEHPRLSWRIESALPATVQTGYRILVSTDPGDLETGENLIWDSGDVPSDRSVLVPYEGPELESRRDYYWKVRVATNHGDTLWSEPSRWSMALLDDSDWQARWIGYDSCLNRTDTLGVFSRLAARYLRKEFDAGRDIAQARLYISGLGLYECYLNGCRVGEDVLAPTATDYTKTVCYNVYDVTDLLDEGVNTIGVILGNGRFFSMRTVTYTIPFTQVTIPGVRNYGYPKLLAQLEITDSEGNRTVVASDENWKLTTDGPIVANNEYDGETYDARLEMPGWSRNGYDDSSWRDARSVAAPEGRLTAQANPNIRVMDTVEPVSIAALNDSTWIVDMGQNMVGWLAVELEGRKDRPVRLRFAETLQDDGNLYVDNLRGAKATDLYTPAEDGTFSWTPRFTYHGFRYVEIAGAAAKPDLEKLKGEVIYDAMPTTGRFETSDSTINQVYRNAYWGLRGNYRSMPTDCPQRDERMGWLGDRAIECIGESFMFRQALLYEKWARDIRDSQLPDGMIPDLSPTYRPFYSENVTYPAAYLCVVDMLYNQYGDEKAVREHYPAMKKWIDYANERLVENDIVVKDVYGDWCMPPESPELIHSQDPARVTDGRLVGTSFFYRLLNMMARFAAVAGHEEDIPAYLEQAARVKDAYNRMFLNPETGQYANNTVSAGLLSLVQGLVPDTLKQKVFDELVRRTEVDFDSHVSTGMIGMQFMMRGLSRYGRPDLALTLATNRTYPSWGYMIDRGATTIWELWNGDTADPAMNSGNHLMQLGDLIAWDWENLAGIQADPAAPGFKHILMKPDFPQGLEWVDASYESMYGTIGSHWKRTGGGLSWSVEIPANTTATLRVPASDVSQVEADGKPLAENPALTDVRASDGFVTFEAGSGSYRFLVGK